MQILEEKKKLFISASTKQSLLRLQSFDVGGERGE